MSQRTYIACHQPVSEQHSSPPNSFLDQLIDAINPLQDDVFDENERYDIYSVMLGSLGPYADLLHRKAIMCEVCASKPLLSLIGNGTKALILITSTP
jgi:hypothetical protein